jgi:hypothetical protein
LGRHRDALNYVNYEARGGGVSGFYFYGGRARKVGNLRDAYDARNAGVQHCRRSYNTSTVQTHHQGQAESDKFLNFTRAK